MKRKAFLISIPAAVLWFGAAFFMAKWTLYWLKGNLVSGNNTSGVVLPSLHLTFCPRFWHFKKDKAE